MCSMMTEENKANLVVWVVYTLCDCDMLSYCVVLCWTQWTVYWSLVGALCYTVDLNSKNILWLSGPMKINYMKCYWLQIFSTTKNCLVTVMQWHCVALPMNYPSISSRNLGSVTLHACSYLKLIISMFFLVAMLRCPDFPDQLTCKWVLWDMSWLCVHLTAHCGTLNTQRASFGVSVR